MKNRHLFYPTVAETPSIFINVLNARTGRKELFQMLLDTGASRTCFPAKMASFLGHNNTNNEVKTTTATGIGGDSPAYIHTLRFELIDPEAKTWSKLIPPWRSKKLPVLFIEKMETQIGLLGRDILKQWSSITFYSQKDKKCTSWIIEIAL